VGSSWKCQRRRSKEISSSKLDQAGREDRPLTVCDHAEQIEETLRLLPTYYVPAGVSTFWIKSIVPIIKRADLWQSGGDPIEAKTGIVTYPLET